MTTISLTALPEDVILLIAAYLLPPWDDIAKAAYDRQVRVNKTRGIFIMHEMAGMRYNRSPDTMWDGFASREYRNEASPSLVSLASLNASCTKMNRVTNPLLWADVTWSSNYDYKAVRSHLVPLIHSIWFYDDEGPSEASRTNEIGSMLSDAYPTANVAAFATHLEIERYRCGSGLGGGSVAHLRLIGSNNCASTWYWRSLRRAPRDLVQVDMQLPTVETPIPVWLKVHQIQQWNIECKQPQVRLLLPDVFSLSNADWSTNEVVLKWAASDDRDIEEIFQGMVDQVAQWHLQGRQPALFWPKLALEATLTLGKTCKGVTVSQPFGDAFSAVLFKALRKYCRYTPMEFCIYDPSTAQCIWRLATPDKSAQDPTDGGETESSGSSGEESM